MLGLINNNNNNFNDHLLKGFEHKIGLITIAQRKLNLLKKIKFWTTNDQLRILTNSILNGPIMYGIQNWIHSNVLLIEKIEI